MKSLNLFLVLILVAILSGCYSYKIKKYEINPETGEKKLVAYTEYSHNITPEMLEADYKSKIMNNVAEQIKPHLKTDTNNVYMNSTAALTAMEIGGRYYLSTGYGTKRIDSKDGTVIGSVTVTSKKSSSSNSKTEITRIPGWYKSNQYWHPIWDSKGYLNYSEDEALFLSTHPTGSWAKSIEAKKTELYK